MWLSFCDRFDENLSNKDIKIEIENDDDYGEYQQIQPIRGVSGFATAICQNVVKKGDKQSWTFQIENLITIFGIIDDKLARKKKGNVKDFSIITGGYGLYLNNMGRYHGSWFPTDAFEYGKQFELGQGDMVTMELDLTKETGILRFTIHSQLKNEIVDKEFNNIFDDEIDVDRKWRAAVAISSSSSIIKLLPYIV